MTIIMKNDGVIRNGKLQYNLNTEAAKVSALLSSKFEKFESFAGEKSIITKIT